MMEVIVGPDGVASSRIVGALASIIFYTPHKLKSGMMTDCHNTFRV